ncbi:TRP-domain-containing protein [Penicillium verhagenii]|nr:TRP-domain-containing protein [Penicillium verhagenii]
MRFPVRALSLWVLSFAHLISAMESITTSALAICQPNSGVSVSYFTAKLSRDGMLELAFDGSVTITGKVTAEVNLLVYGYTLLNETINLCALDVSSLCPIASGNLDIPSASLDVSSILSDVPGIGYTVPDLDAKIIVYVKNETTGATVACLSADLSNGHTVDQLGVSWALALLAGLGLCGAAISFVRGHLHTATHVSFFSFSLLTFMQSQATIGLSSTELPPITQSWTQMFQWSIGILKLGFLQTLCTWYLRSTGGTPATIEQESKSVSVIVEKRSLIQETANLAHNLFKRTTDTTTDLTSTSTSTGQEITVRGINRMAYRAGIESTNIFMTSYALFMFFGALAIIAIFAFKYTCQLLAKSNKLSDRLRFAAAGLNTTSREIFLRFLIIATPSAAAFCIWEFTRLDSAGEVVLAVTWWVGITLALAWTAAAATFQMHRSRGPGKNTTNFLYSGLNNFSRKMNFFHRHYTPTAFYFFAIIHLYTQAKGIVIAASQSAPKAQGIVLVVIDAIMVGLVIWIRPYVDKSMNRFGITTAIIGFLNSICVLIFSDIFKGPNMLISVVGVLFVVYNAVYMLVLVIFLIITFVYAFAKRDPDSRYKRAVDTSSTFDSSADLPTTVPTEIEELGVTARGEPKQLPAHSSSSLLLHSHHDKTPRSRDT